MKSYLQLKCLLLVVAVWGLSTGAVFAQQEVSGTVTDGSTSESLPGVNILVKGTSQGTSTGADGMYQLEVSSLSDTLVFSFVGYQTQEIPINGRTEIDITLQPQALVGEDLVVVGYGEQSEQSVTGSISSVEFGDLEETPSVTTGDALVGRVQGVTARQADARPGSSPQIEIRNMGDPLYVIDGVPSSEGDFAQLGQGDIESISVLKDASAAVYGIRASSGVVLVETKDGGYGEQTEINIDGYYGWQTFTRYPQPANAYQFVRGKLYAQQNRGENPNYLGINSSEQLREWRNGDDYKSYDYYDIVMEPSVPQNQLSASVSGGSESISYYLSATRLGQQAIIDDYSFSRNNIQANIEGTISDRLTIGTQISGRIENRQQVGVPGLDDYFNPFLSISTMWPTESPYANDNPNYVNGDVHNINVNPATYTEDVTGWIDDIWREAKVNLYAEYDFDFGLSLKGTGSYGYGAWDFDGFEYTYNGYVYNEETDEYNAVQGNDNPWRERRWRNEINRFFQFQANYEADFGKHSIAALAAYERSDYRGDEQRVHTVPDNNYVNIMSFDNQDILVHDIGKSAHAGYVGRVNYNFDEKYLVEFVGRYDGSFLFPSESRWGFFPGVSAGWRISEEDFFQEAVGSTITNLKLRASYGRTGSETDSGGNYLISPYSYLAGYNFGGDSGSSVLDGQYYAGVGPRNRPITNFSWITAISKNIGLDVSFFEDRLSATIDVFERERDGLPGTPEDEAIPSELGYNTPIQNLNSDVTRGVEGSVSYQGQVGTDISYRVGANATISRWRQQTDYNFRAGNSWDEYRNSEIGRWSAITWGYQVIGRFQSQEQIDNYPVEMDGQSNTTAMPGDFIYKDVNGDGIITGLDQRPIGYAQGWNPYTSFGLNGMFSYKGASLSFNFAGAAMQSYTRNWELRYFFQNNGNSPEFMLTDRWHRADPFDPSSEWIAGDYPANRGANYNHYNYESNTYWTHNIWYLRLQNLQVGYDLPKSLLSKVGVNSLNVYVRGTNIFSFDNMKDYEIDPEISAENGLVYPRQSLYSIGFNISL
ncbi:SusC/RagA family TonB-linked outer membrane protein [Fodinibius salsisoli]|uniref:SusC/RagA family TonB-linked outer membrane protein n=1 Tax=Fodinibius salsisoli TaxID=2820877 RepID=A0ABT3PJK1_9BACT|nr:SusC/RagA family TonB-linked outer membrane protein [Fodinibius salsisoli]MCW9706091.1 SusC/RagA family TonB-linked outer membrane protein [Fodinibius salsisoli]